MQGVKPRTENNNTIKRNMKNMIVKLGCLAVAIAAMTALTSASFAAESKTAKGGASELMKLKPIKTGEDLAALKEGDSVVMACPKCKTVYVTKVTKENKPNQTSTVGAAVHGCPGCDHKISTAGHGKNAKDVITHVCRTCGSEDAFCCVLKAGAGSTKGMEKESKH